MRCLLLVVKESNKRLRYYYGKTREHCNDLRVCRPAPLLQNRRLTSTVLFAGVDTGRERDDTLVKRKAEHTKPVLYHYDASSIFRAKNLAVGVAEPAVEVREINLICKPSRSGCIGCSEGIASKSSQNWVMIWGPRMTGLSLRESAPTAPFHPWIPPSPLASFLMPIFQ